MDTDRIDRRTLRSALELASRAPSVHNSQPWAWRLGQRSAHLHVDPTRWLRATDPTGRDLVVSCGAVLHHLRIALAAVGIGGTVHRFPNTDADPDHLAAIELAYQPTSDADIRLAAAIGKRRTDRRSYTHWPVPRGFLDRLSAAAEGQGAVLNTVDEAGRHLVADAIAVAAQLQGGELAYRTETSLWTGRYASTDGIPAANLIQGTGLGGTALARRFSDGEIQQVGVGPDGGELLVLGTSSDDPLSRLRGGEALSAVLLEATDLGLATCPLSQPLEAGSTYRRIRDELLGGVLCPQVLVRVGWAHHLTPPRTPRRPLAETLGRMP
ncbi:NAD(P)H nitroreductase [Actinomycetes bacterium KLBMP 9759]